MVILQQIMVFLMNIFKNTFLTRIPHWKISKVLQFPKRLISRNLQYFHQNILLLFYYTVSYLHIILQKQQKNCNAKIFRNSFSGFLILLFSKYVNHLQGPRLPCTPSKTLPNNCKTIHLQSHKSFLISINSLSLVCFFRDTTEAPFFHLRLTLLNNQWRKPIMSEVCGQQLHIKALIKCTFTGQ